MNHYHPCLNISSKPSGIKASNLISGLNDIFSLFLYLIIAFKYTWSLPKSKFGLMFLPRWWFGDWAYVACYWDNHFSKYSALWQMLKLAIYVYHIVQTEVDFLVKLFAINSFHSFVQKITYKRNIQNIIP